MGPRILDIVVILEHTVFMRKSLQSKYEDGKINCDH